MAEKKNIFKRTYENIKEKINDAILETKIETSFKEKNDLYTLYTKNNSFSTKLSGYFMEDKIVVYGKHNIPQYSIIISDCGKNVYYITKSEDIQITTNLNGTEYTRIGTKLYLDKNVEELNVIKAGKRYFRSKNNEA